MMSLRSLLNLTRLHTAGWEALIFVLGPLVVGATLFDVSVMRLWLLGILVNSFIFTLNDLADLPRDRLDPSRQNSPLVSGSLSTAFALWFSVALPILMWLLIAPATWPTAAEVGFAVLLLLGAYLCVYQKTSDRLHPLILDLLFAVAMAGPIPVGIAALDLAIPGRAWVLTGAFMVLCVGLNAIGGNLKDLSSDLNTGFRTTAIALGVRPGDCGAVEISAHYRRFMYAVAAVTVLAISGAVILIWRDLSSSTAASLSLVIAALCLGLLRDIHRLATGARPPSPRGREPFFAYGLAAILLAALPYAKPAHLLGALALAVVWDYGLRLLWSMGSGRARRVGGDDRPEHTRRQSPS